MRIQQEDFKAKECGFTQTEESRVYLLSYGAFFLDFGPVILFATLEFSTYILACFKYPIFL